MDDKNLKYQSVIDFIKELVRNNSLQPGDKLYSENQLREMFSVSRQTIRHAIGLLVEEGILTRIQGSGTYISDRRTINLEKQNRIALVTTYVESYIFPKTIQGIEKVLFEKGLSVQISFTNNTLERERIVLEDIINRNDVAGIIVEGTKSGLPNSNAGLYQKIMDKKIPLLFINTFYPEVPAPHVSLNDIKAAEIAVDYLIEKGHTKIGTILKLDDGQGRLRYLGYLKALEKAGLEVSDARMVWLDTDDAKQLSLCMDKILTRIESATALLCYNDQIAFQLIRLLSDRGVLVPKDLSIISIDDSDLAIHSEVPITSLPHPKEALGEKAAELLIEMIEGKKRNENYEFDTRVIERESVALI